MNNAAKVPVQIVHNDIYSRVSDMSAAGSLPVYISTEKAWKMASSRASKPEPAYVPELALKLAKQAADRGTKW